ncbi:putative glycosyl transferase family 2 protein [Selenomonas ruminantium subsp. lactilytica TAM6421]|uniref:Putative glycosyl transferase family 2 protein n=1 Tax=Selenomonas ruminantium subsp. lactilytica (strain NBRC 103574 / TAM6421) TaxID=927704 RepID=I0GUF9_SELRL|nr:glycosyltransferase [Selenomonas ruminantium]BAL84396.1 putative glycosyl transferase family 2 protein [Selenomonas ruminantium subsp. lactilytica TAM6421]
MGNSELSPRVSVIMGVYNAMGRKEQLLQSIHSILNQNYKNFEFIICDDCSEDDTCAFIKKIAEYDDRIVLLQNERNMRLAFTLNRCLGVARGEYIARMDDDDVSYPDRLKKEVEFLDDNQEISIVGSNAEYIDETGVWGESNEIRYPQKKDLLWGPCFIHPSVMMRKNAIDILGGYNNSTRRGQDYELWMRLYAAGYKGANIAEKLLQYRWDKEAYKKRKFIYRIEEAKIRYKGFKKLGLHPRGLLFVIKPLLAGIIPNKIIRLIHEIILSSIKNSNENNIRGIK